MHAGGRTGYGTNCVITDAMEASFLRGWLKSRAHIGEAALEAVISSLGSQDVYELRDLYALANLPGRAHPFALEDVLAPLTSTRIRAALELTPMSQMQLSPCPMSPPPSPPQGLHAKSAAPAAEDGPPTRKRSTGTMDMKTAISAMKLKHMQETAADIHIPWWILDPTGDVILKQRRRLRDERQRSEELEELREANTDGVSGYSMEELEAYSKAQQARARQTKQRQKRGRPSRVARWFLRLLYPCRHPEELTLYPSWDMLTAVALLFTAGATPYEVGFLPQANSVTEPLFVTNRIIDFIFLMDMSFQFVLMFERKIHEDGMDLSHWETRLRPIAQRYLRSPYFVIDVCSIVPSIFDIIITVQSDQDSDSGLAALKSLRVVRVLRLIKLLRLVKASKVVARLSDQLSWSQQTLKLCRLFFTALLVLHAFACVLGISATFPATPKETWLVRLGFCASSRDAIALSLDPSAATIHPILDDLLSAAREGRTAAADLSRTTGELNLDTSESFVCVSAGERYLNALGWGFDLLTGGDSIATPGPFEPYLPDHAAHATSLSLSETVLVLVLKILGTFIWSLIFGDLVVSLTNGADPGQVAFDQSLDLLNSYIRDLDVPTHLAKELRRFLHENRSQQIHKLRMETVKNLPPGLTEKIAWTLHLDWLTAIPCFRGLRDFSLGFQVPIDQARMNRFLTNVVLKMNSITFISGDRPPAGALYLLMKGYAQYTDDDGHPNGIFSRALGPSDSWGAEDMVLSHPRILYRLRVTALTYLHVQSLERSDFEGLQKHFPGECQAVRRRVLKDTFRADMNLAAYKFRLQKWEARQKEREAAAVAELLGRHRGSNGGARSAQDSTPRPPPVSLQPDEEPLDEEDVVISSLSPRKTPPPSAGVSSTKS